MKFVYAAAWFGICMMLLTELQVLLNYFHFSGISALVFD